MSKPDSQADSTDAGDISEGDASHLIEVKLLDGSRALCDVSHLRPKSSSSPLVTFSPFSSQLQALLHCKLKTVQRTVMEIHSVRMPSYGTEELPTWAKLPPEVQQMISSTTFIELGRGGNRCAFESVFVHRCEPPLPRCHSF